MQMLRGLGLKTIEIPTDPETGISIEAPELALDQWPIGGDPCQTATTRWALSCRTPASARC